MNLTRAIQIAMVAHDGQVDKQGQPYVQHLIAVTAGVAEARPDLGKKAQIAAVLHDLHEDTELRIIDPPWLVEVLDLLTRHGGYSTYIDRIARSPVEMGPIARAVKLADLEHNLSRMTPELEYLRARYEQAREFLEAAILAD